MFENKKIKVLMLSDHPLSTSGVGCQSRYLIHGLLETKKYSFRCFGGAVKHSDYNTVVVNPDFIVKPIDGFGDKNTLRHALITEKPDVLLLFTDPRFFHHVWSAEDEVHQVCPIAYNTLWDNGPYPEFNNPIYECVDLLNCINYPTYEMLKSRFPDKTNYVPHAIPPDAFLKANPVEVAKFKKTILGEHRMDHFVFLFVSRNARRKMPSDILLSFKDFLDRLEKSHGHRKASMCLHTDALDSEGPNLFHVVEMLGIKENVVFSGDRVGFAEMCGLYNIGDCVVSRSCNEGFGLSVLESKMCEKPVIALKTGGVSRQVEDHETGFQYGVAMEPECRSLVGNQYVPYIFEDFVTHETVTKAMMTIYEMGPEKRAEIGKLSREHALKNYNMDVLVKSWDDSLTKLVSDWRSTKRKRWSTIEL